MWISQMDGRVVLSDFGRAIFFARTGDMNTIHIPIKTVPGYDRWKMLADRDAEFESYFSSVKYIHEFSEKDIDDFATGKDESAASKKLKKNLNSFYEWQEKFIEQNIRNTVRDQVGFFRDISRRFRSAMTPHNPSRFPEEKDFFRQVLGESPGEGNMTITFAAPFEDMEHLKKRLKNQAKLDFSELSAFVFMTEDTAKKIINSPTYKELVKKSDPLVMKYKIAVVDQRWAAMNPSVREPLLLDELYGTLESDKLRIRKVYDPLLDKDNEFHLVDTSKSEYSKLSVAVVGGFAYQPITAFLQRIYVEAKLKEESQKNPQSRFFPYHFTFQKGQAIDDKGQFPIQQISTTLNQKGEGKENVEMYIKWTQDAMNFVSSYFKNTGKEFMTTYIWDNGKILPAAVGDYGQRISKGAIARTKRLFEEQQPKQQTDDVQIEQTRKTRQTRQIEAQVIDQTDQIDQRNNSQCLNHYRKLRVLK